MKTFYQNIGKKLQSLAKFIGGLGLVCIALGIVCMLFGIDDDEFLILGLIAAGSGITTLISSWPLYAFGQITDDIAAIRASVTTSTELTPKA